MQEHDDDPPSSQQQAGSQLQPLAPRHSRSSFASSRDRASGLTSGRTARLSHRSRAGCWTCRARKVKCDESKPTCGPCSRLNRPCDWDHRWNFNDATFSTKIKYANVTTAGNTVWDPHARRSPDASPDLRQHDDMPAFTLLTNDEERERKAVTQLPGTFNVVVTPESFADLPEYAGTVFASNSRRQSVQSHASSLPLQSPTYQRTPSRSLTDPNVVVLDRFEDAGTYGSSLETRRASLPDPIQYLTISKSSPAHSTTATSPLGDNIASSDPLVSHFRRYLLARLVQPQLYDLNDSILSNKTKDVFEIEATRFPPLHQAICALSALNLSHKGAASVDSAHWHYGQALSAASTSSIPEDLFSSGTFLRHFLLFVYDICIHMQHDDGPGSNMWAIHLEHLQRIALSRHSRLGPEKHGYIIWAICELDVYACLLGSGDCSFINTMTQNQIMPSLDQQIPAIPNGTMSPYLPDEAALFPPILALRQAILMKLAKLAQAARSFRLELTASMQVSTGAYARWQARASQLQAELITTWSQYYPPFLPPESPQAGVGLPDRPRHVFEQAFLLYQSATLYSRTSLFHRQLSIPLAHHSDILADTETRILSILALANAQLQFKQLERRQIIFPLFMAGVATRQAEVKVQVLDLIKAYEGFGVGGNTYTTRRLLAAVFEEQRAAVELGGKVEDVEWLAVARKRSLTVVNCGL